MKVKDKKRGFWTTQDMKHAITALQYDKISLRKAARDFQIPRSTLKRKFDVIKNGEEVDFAPNLGRYSNTFNAQLENQLVFSIKWMDSRLMPFTRTEFLKFAYDLAIKMKLKNQFNTNNKSAGKTFYYNFMIRHPGLSLRTPQSTSYQRAVGFNKNQVDIFFSKYLELVAEYKFTADRIYNCDETGVSIVQNNSNKVLSVLGKKQVSSLTAAERGRNVTVLFTINAAGNVFVPPMFIFPNKRRVDQILEKNAPEGSLFAAEEMGWITS